MCLVINNNSSLCIPEAEPEVYTPSELESRFKKLRFIDSGGEGCVYEVEEKRTGFRMALKIANNNWSISEDNKRVAKI